MMNLRCALPSVSLLLLGVMLPAISGQSTETHFGWAKLEETGDATFYKDKVTGLCLKAPDCSNQNIKFCDCQGAASASCEKGVKDTYKPFKGSISQRTGNKIHMSYSGCMSSYRGRQTGDEKCADYDVGVGPYVKTDEQKVKVGDVARFQFSANRGSDDYEMFAGLYSKNRGLVGYKFLRGESAQGSLELAADQEDDYFVLFMLAGYDRTGGGCVSSSMDIWDVVVTKASPTPAPTPAPTPPVPTPAPTPACTTLYNQCAGKISDTTTFSGPRCCAGSTCVKSDDWYSQCRPTQAPTPAPTPAPPTPPPPPPTPKPTLGACVKQYKQCGGKANNFETLYGSVVCCAGNTCVNHNLWWSQCEPTPPAPAPPSPTPLPGPGNWQTGMGMTHYWDCNGQGCDVSTLQPFIEARYISPPGYGPQDPKDFVGGPIYGEQMWLTAGASDALSRLLDGDDACCGSDPNDGGVGGCGKCLLVQNPDSLQPTWTAVVMKKNRCPPSSHLCASGVHLNIAVPGFDNPEYSTNNRCSRSCTGFGNNPQKSSELGRWWNTYQNTGASAHLCENLPLAFRKGCKLFASWGWKTGDPHRVKYKKVSCPVAFKNHVQAQFSSTGPLPFGTSAEPQCPAARML